MGILGDDTPDPLGKSDSPEIDQYSFPNITSDPYDFGPLTTDPFDFHATIASTISAIPDDILEVLGD